jgi:hypothetical protein
MYARLKVRIDCVQRLLSANNVEPGCAMNTFLRSGALHLWAWPEIRHDVSSALCAMICLLHIIERIFLALMIENGHRHGHDGGTAGALAKKHCPNHMKP